MTHNTIGIYVAITIIVALIILNQPNTTQQKANCFTQCTTDMHDTPGFNALQQLCINRQLAQPIHDTPENKRIDCWLIADWEYKDACFDKCHITPDQEREVATLIK